MARPELARERRAQFGQQLTRAKWFLVVLCLSLWFCELAVADESRMAVGINLNQVADYNPTWVFTDIFQQSRPWISFSYNAATGEEKWSGGGPVDADRMGWPQSLRTWTNDQGQQMQQRLGTLMFREIGDKYPAGTYYAEWEGEGLVEFAFAAKVTKQGVTKDGKNFAELNVTPQDGGIHLKISRMSESNPIRNIHVWMPDYAGESFRGKTWKPGADFSPFHPVFKERLSAFQVIRFMDWAEINANKPHRWSERPLVSMARQAGDGRGVAIEYMIALANELKKDVWLNMPHAADDEYVRNYAELVRETLDPSLKIYVEWSNELWNFAPGFVASSWLKEQTKLAKHGGKSNWEIAGQEIKRDFAIWTDVFKAEPDRIVRVVAGQAANVWITGELGRVVGAGNFDAFSAAAYVQLDEKQRARFSASTSADEVLDAAFQYLPRLRKDLIAHSKLCDSWSKKTGEHVELLAYEAGQHIDARGQKVPYQQAFYNAQTHPRMGKLYKELIEVAKEANMTAFNHYAFVGRDTPHGSWGALTYQNQPTSESPKLDALLQELHAN